MRKNEEDKLARDLNFKPDEQSVLVRRLRNQQLKRIDGSYTLRASWTLLGEL